MISILSRRLQQVLAVMAVGFLIGMFGGVTPVTAAGPVSASLAGSVPDLAIGQQDVELLPIVVTENGPGAIDAGSDGQGRWLRLEFPAGVLPTRTAGVQVEGDLQLEQDSVNVSFDRSTNLWGIEVKIQAASSEPSRIVFSGIKVTADRTVPEGEMVVKVKGDSLIQNLDDFPGADYAASVVVANCTTAAPLNGEQDRAVFTIGKDICILNGEQVKMEVAPYIVDGYTFIPLRYAAQAVGVPEDGLLWNDEGRTVTIIKGSRIVQMTVGEGVMKINQAETPMNAAPEIRNGRTMLPIRDLSVALGITVDWDDAARTVTIRQ
jgi:hypothetical protein